MMIHKAQRAPKRVVFPEGEERQDPARLPDPGRRGHRQADPARRRGDDPSDAPRSCDLHLDGVEIVDPAESPALHALRRAALRAAPAQGRDRGTRRAQMMQNRNVLRPHDGAHGRRRRADRRPDRSTTPRPSGPALQVIEPRPGVQPGRRHLHADHAEGPACYFLADTTVNIDPTAEDLAEIAIMAAEMARRFDVEPRVAMLSFSNFGSTRHPLARQGAPRGRDRRASARPDLMVDGEMQADTAVDARDHRRDLSRSARSRAAPTC